MTGIEPGWYRDPVDATLQRYWDGEGYLGEPLPSDVTPPQGPPPTPPPLVPMADPTPGSAAPDSPGGRPGPAHQPGSHPTGSHQAGTHPAGSQLGSGQAAGTQPAARSATAPTADPGAPPAQWPGAGSGQVPGGPPVAGPPVAGPPAAGPVPPGWPAYPRLVLPPPRPHGHRLATLGARFVARMIDTLVVLGLNILVNGYFVYQYIDVNRPYWEEATRRVLNNEPVSGVAPPERAGTLMIIILVLAAALWFAYEVPSIANTGQTIGKRLARIRVMRLESAEPLGFGRAIRRWNTLGLPTLLWSCGIGFVLQFVGVMWAVFDRPLHQALHDKSAVTVVVAVDPTAAPTSAAPERPTSEERKA